MEIKEEEKILCDHCEKAIDEEELTETDNGDKVCQNCLDSQYFTCGHCGGIKDIDEGNRTGDDYVCNVCYEQYYFTCEACSGIYHNDRYGSDGLCEMCMERDNNCAKPYSTTDEYVTRGKRAWSCEIEAYPKYSDELSNVCDELPKGVGMGEDGSLKSNGVEFQTPKLSGTKGKNLLKKLCELLSDNGFYVDESCGLHLHLDTKDYTNELEKIKKLILFYLHFEPVIYSYLPYSRRKNTYCLPLASFYHEKEIMECETLDDLDKIWYREQSKTKIAERKSNKYDSTRYAGVNMHSLLANGHIEIRHHSGTINLDKILNWAMLHLAILNTISKKDIEMDRIAEVKYLLSLEDKQKNLFEVLQLDSKLQKYFTARAVKFGSVETTDNEKVSCAE